QPARHYDPSGLATIERIDFKGAVVETTRTLVSDVAAAFVDWNVRSRQSLLETETFHQITEHDALGRTTRLYNWHRDTVQGNSTPGRSDRVAVYVPSYNQRGLLKSQTLHVRASKTTVSGKTSFTANADTSRSVDAITHIDWNARGQRLSLTLGNGTVTRYTYDDETFRLTHLYTRRGSGF